MTTVSGSSVEEICAFIAAFAVKCDDEGDDGVLSRLVFVEDPTTWRGLLRAPHPEILVPLDPSFADDVGSGNIHAVLVPTDGQGGDISLGPVDSQAVAESLRTSGVSDLRRSEQLGKLARRSLSAFRRRIASKPALHQPRWAKGAVHRDVKGFLLAGRWNDASDGDRSQLKFLTGLSDDGLHNRVSDLALADDPFITGLGSTWSLVSPVDAWLLLKSSLQEEDFKRFETVAVTVLGEGDPTLDIDPGERWWRTSISGTGKKYSPQLTRGLARSLALLGTLGNDDVGTVHSGADWASSIVRTLLAAANSDESGRGWASIAGQLPLLAEAAPGAFLDAVEEALIGNAVVARAFFSDGPDSHPLTTSSMHTHVLWGLETTAWSSEYFSQSVDLLCKLDLVDPGGQQANRPANSLLNILRPWHPDTAASPGSRLMVFDNIRKNYPDRAWKLGLALLPEAHGSVHFPTRSPEYREWKPDKTSVPAAEYWGFIAEVLNRCIQDAGNDWDRWAEIFDRYANLAPSDREKIRASFQGQIPNLTSGSDRAKLWSHVRKVIADHREFPEAAWSLPEEEIVKLDDLIEKLAPPEPHAQHEWLFQDWSPHLEGARILDNYDTYEALLEQKREEAIASIVDSEGLTQISQLVSNVRVPEAVGWSLGGARPIFDDELLESLKLSASAAERQLAERYFARRFVDEGWDWLEGLLTKRPELSAYQRALLLLLSRDFPRSADTAEQDAEVAKVFWSHFSPPTAWGITLFSLNVPRLG
ncbi:hypothetical protein FHX74_002245 [Friedmanniella endophytica]|uniref:Uncharacterized protein n=1 Tax=Microlunatus kandeliicorticis TaxID=1759536 RepID=A0A7W3P627_9ACTN|nr:hypothetical protein [Microlunatus kandeliicorticis]